MNNKNIYLSHVIPFSCANSRHAYALPNRLNYGRHGEWLTHCASLARFDFDSFSLILFLSLLGSFAISFQSIFVPFFYFSRWSLVNSLCLPHIDTIHTYISKLILFYDSLSPSNPISILVYGKCCCYCCFCCFHHCS